MNKCKYCGTETRLHKPLPDGSRVCFSCEEKLPTVRKFVAECNRIKRLLGIDQEGEEKNG